jgi:hypothetical protein
MTDTQVARERLYKAMKEYGQYGASDSEGMHAVDRIEEAILTGKRFPFESNDNGPVAMLLKSNPFQLYESVEGWQEASTRLVALCRSYWRSALIENLGLGL